MSGGAYLKDDNGDYYHYTDEELAEKRRSERGAFFGIAIIAGLVLMFVFDEMKYGAIVALIGAIGIFIYPSYTIGTFLGVGIGIGILWFLVKCGESAEEKEKKEAKKEQVAQAPSSISTQSNVASFKAEEINEAIEEYDGPVYEEEEVEDNYSSNETAMNEESSYSGKSETNKVVETMPTFPGGNEALMKYLSDNVKVPLYAEENGIQGKVVVSYVIDFDGSVIDVQVVQSVHPVLDEEAVRVVKNMPKWTAGTRNGMAVRTKYSIPINFRFQ